MGCEKRTDSRSPPDSVTRATGRMELMPTPGGSVGLGENQEFTLHTVNLVHLLGV